MANSNLVLTAEQRLEEERNQTEQTKPEAIKNGKGSSKRAKKGQSENFSAKRARPGTAMSVLDMETAGLYRPKTKETKAAYESLLSSIRSQFGDAPHDVLCGAADEILATLKNDSLRDPERQAEVGKLLGQVSDEKFSDSVAVGGHEMDEELGVAVEFEDEDEEDEDEDGLVRTIVDDEEEADDIPVEEGNAVRADGGDEMEIDGQMGGGSTIPAQEIDAFWLQRRISRRYDDLDATQAQQLAEQVFQELQSSDTREMENKLVMLLDFERFDLVKELIINKDRIVWCMRLGRAENETERKQIEDEMGLTANGKAVLNELKGTRASARDRGTAVERSIREEARKLRSQENGFQQGISNEGVSNRKILDLESLKFAEEGHLNSNKSTSLPQGSYRTVHKGYEEVHVPALKAKPFAKGEKLKAIKELPEWAQPGFKGMKSLNRIQSQVYDTALFSSENMLVCAPTGAGKTNVAMLSMLHEIGMHRKGDGTIDTSAFKMIYVAPMKALVAEMVGNFSKRLEPYGIKVRELTGDISLTKSEIEETQLIIVTPEKWDIITRKSGERAYTQLVKLVIIDEIHLLHDTEVLCSSALLLGLSVK
eukprot:jgi/Picre1/27085/NNA_000055.t1